MEFLNHRQPPEEWIDLLDAWVKDMRIRGNTENTIEHWWYKVGHLAITSRKSPETIIPADIIAWLSRGVGTNSIRADCNAANAFFSWAERTGHRTDNPMTVIPQTRRDKRKQRPAPKEAVRKGLSHPDWRVRLIVMMLDETGMRRSEICVAHTKDVADDLVGKSLVVHGKGRKDRIVPLSDALAWEIGKLPEGYFFPGDDRGHICSDTVYRLVKQATGYTPHAFRRKFATDMWHATGDAVKVKELLGHESLETTQGYIFTTAEDLRPAVETLRTYRRQCDVGFRPEKILEAYNVPGPVARNVVQTIRTMALQESV